MRVNAITVDIIRGNEWGCCKEAIECKWLAGVIDENGSAFTTTEELERTGRYGWTTEDTARVCKGRVCKGDE